MVVAALKRRPSTECIFIYLYIYIFNVHTWCTFYSSSSECLPED